MCTVYRGFQEAALSRGTRGGSRYVFRASAPGYLFSFGSLFIISPRLHLFQQRLSFSPLRRPAPRAKRNPRRLRIEINMSTPPAEEGMWVCGSVFTNLARFNVSSPSHLVRFCSRLLTRRLGRFLSRTKILLEIYFFQLSVGPLVKDSFRLTDSRS